MPSCLGELAGGCDLSMCSLGATLLGLSRMHISFFPKSLDSSHKALKVTSLNRSVHSAVIFCRVRTLRQRFLWVL